MTKSDILEFTGLTEKQFYEKYKKPEDWENSSMGKKFMAKTGGSFKPHMMYNPKTKKGKKVMTYKEHLALKKKGWGHTAPKAQVGNNLINFNNLGQTNYMEDTAVVADSFLQQQFPGLGLTPLQQSNQQTLSQLNNANVSEGVSTPSANTFNQIGAGIQDLGNFFQESKQEGKNRDIAEQRMRVLQPAREAIVSTLRENERVRRNNLQQMFPRPEDYSTTGEAFFPVYGTAKSGINIKPENKGKFTAWAKKRGMSVAEAADKVMANKSKYSKEVVKMANFAKNARSFNKAQDGGMFNGEYMPLTNPNQQKQFKGGGFVYGGGPAGQIGSSLGQIAAGENSNALGRFSGNVLGTAGLALAGPIGGAVGQFIGNTLIGSFDPRAAETQRYNKQSNRIQGNINNILSGQALHSGIAATRNGGEIKSMRSGGHMRGNYIPPNPSALDTMAMGGDVKTLWGGEAETVSYNPYAGGESIEFKGNSHSYRDPKTGQTGIGVAYGENAVNNNEPSVEVENEPAQKLRDGGGDENLVVFGDMIDYKTNKKYKHEVRDLNKQEAKINKRQEKVANLGLESDDTVFGQLERNTADTVLKGSDMKLRSIGDTKRGMANRQEFTNVIFNALGADANKFMKTGKLVKDPMRIENSKISKYGNNVPKAQDGPPDKLKTNELPDEPKVFDSVEEAEKAGFSYNEEKDRWEKETSKGTESAELSIEALEEVRKGQSENKETGLFGNVTIEQFEESKKANPWFDWENFDPNNEADVERYQKEFNKRAEEAGDPTRLQIDGRFGEQTASARFSQAQEATSPEYEVATVTEPEEIVEEETAAPINPLNMLNFRGDEEYEKFDPSQLSGELYAAMTNRLPERRFQKYIPDYKLPVNIDLQAQKNQIIQQQRALMRNPIVQDSPAAAAMISAQASEQLQRIDENEFIRNQQEMMDVYNRNLDSKNQAKLINLDRFGQFEDMRIGDEDVTRRQRIATLDSMNQKRNQYLSDINTAKVLKGLYPTFGFNRNYDLQVEQPTVFNTGQTNTANIAPFISGGGFGGGQTIQQIPGVIGALQSIFRNQEQSNEEESTPAKYGKKVTKNNKNSNILKAIKNL